MCVCAFLIVRIYTTRSTVVRVLSLNSAAKIRYGEVCGHEEIVYMTVCKFIRALRGERLK